MFISDIKERNLPVIVPKGMGAEQWLSYRSKMIELFAREVYGFSPPPPENVRAKELLYEDKSWAGKAMYKKISLGFDTPKGLFTFPVDLVIPRAKYKVPLVVYLSFTPYPCGKYGPIEEIIDKGYALAIFCYNDVTKDDDKGFIDGIGEMYERKNGGSDWGKISMWAWAAGRVMDYVQTLEDIDLSRIYCIGHSRLGKTALWCGVQDRRFAGVGANNSGCSGVAVSRGKKGERISDIVKQFPYWFCENYYKYAGNENKMPFDQSMLVSLMAPRLLAACNAEEDIWCDPDSEYISLLEASAAYDMLGVPGFIAPMEYPKAGTKLCEGRLAFGLRLGTHFMSRHDWMFYLDFFNTHI